MVETAVFRIFHRASPSTPAVAPAEPAAKPALPVAPLPVQPVSPQAETAESSEIHHRAVELPVEQPPPADAVPSGVHDAPDTHDGSTESAPSPHATVLDEAEQDVSEDHPLESDELEAPEPEVLDEPRPHWTPPDHSDHWHNYEAEYEQEPRFETRSLENRPAMALEPEEPAAVGWRIPDGESLTETAPPEFLAEPPHETWLHDAGDGQTVPTAVLEAEPEPEPVVLPAHEPSASPELWQAGATQEPGGIAETGTLNLAGIALEADQLGLAHPDAITLRARLQTLEPIELTASGSGQYRPDRSKATPWAGFGFDHIGETHTGLVAGTRILTSRGEMEVEKLSPGDVALALRGPALLPIFWIGRGAAKAAPVLIEAGALGPNLPRRPLSLGPDQAVFVAPVPVPARSLVNGTTIRMLSETETELFHIDVGKAEVLFAEGVPLSSSSRAGLQIAG